MRGKVAKVINSYWYNGNLDSRLHKRRAFKRRHRELTQKEKCAARRVMRSANLKSKEEARVAQARDRT